MEYTLHFHDGHPIIHTEQDRILIDMGSPTSFHDHGHLPFMGQEFQAEQSQLGGRHGFAAADDLCRHHLTHRDGHHETIFGGIPLR